MAKLTDEEKICGLHACRAFFAQRPQDLRKIYLESSRVHELKSILHQCAKRSIAYKIVPAAELEKISKSTHHEGVVFVAREPSLPSADEMLQKWRDKFADAKTPGCMLLLENIRDPHNVGAILRTAAHFGVDTVLTYGETSKRNAALLRTAEGGAEYVDWFAIQDLTATLAGLRDLGFVCAATSSHASKSLYDGKLPPRIIFMMGAEREGLSDDVAQEAELSIVVPGSGAVESLNVASASAVLLAEFQRQQGTYARKKASTRSNAKPRKGRLATKSKPSAKSSTRKAQGAASAREVGRKTGGQRARGKAKG